MATSNNNFSMGVGGSGGDGGGNNDGDKDRKDSDKGKGTGSFSKFLQKKTKGYFKSQAQGRREIRDTHFQLDRDHLLGYRAWSHNFFGAGIGDEVVFDYWLDGNPFYI